MIKLNKTLILASKSPRRKELLENIGLNPIVIPSNAEEKLNNYNGFADYVMQLAQKKGEEIQNRSEIKNYILVASDTIVEKDGVIFEKPKDENDAFKMLKKLSGSKHSVYTSLYIYDSTSKKKILDYTITKVTFRNISDKVINKYIETKEPLDKAGAYGIQGYGSQFIKNIEGCYFSVMGFPIPLFAEKLNDLGYCI